MALPGSLPGDRDADLPGLRRRSGVLSPGLKDDLSWLRRRGGAAVVFLPVALPGQAVGLLPRDGATKDALGRSLIRVIAVMAAQTRIAGVTGRVAFRAGK